MELKMWGVTQGSDDCYGGSYRVKSIFSRKEDAESYASTVARSRVEEFPLNLPPNPKILELVSSGDSVFTVRMRYDGGIYSITREDVLSLGHVPRYGEGTLWPYDYPEEIKDMPDFHVVVRARTDNDAAKIAMEYANMYKDEERRKLEASLEGTRGL